MIPIRHSCWDCSYTVFESPHKLLLGFRGSIAFLQTVHLAMQRNAIVQCFPEITTATSSHVGRQHSTPRFRNQSCEATPTCSSGFQVPKLLFLALQHGLSRVIAKKELVVEEAHKSTC